MNLKIYKLFLGIIVIINSNLCGQGIENCFIVDTKPKTAVIPKSVDAVKPTGQASVIVTIKGDTIGAVSKYVFGSAIAAWFGSHTDPKLIDGVKKLAPTLIRFPGGSWSNGYFWNKKTPTDVPDSIYDGTTHNLSTGYAKKNEFVGHNGTEGWVTSTDQWYTLLENSNVSEGLITVNYGYARYGTSNDPVAQAAHHAAEWVRYDAGRTKFWEIGNENGGPWEYGWMIDTALNKDGQPQIITGELYGKHFRVFADSMRKAASEIGATIYIGGQILQSQPQPGYMWYFVDKDWNQGFFKEAGNYADFYVIHNYISGSNVPKQIITDAATNLTANMNFIKQQINVYNGDLKPVALTEYNIGSGSEIRGNSYINGMQAVVLICELIKNNFGLGARWLLEGMFSGPSTSPRPEFYYLSFLQNFYGDHALSTLSSNSDILCYASRYSSGETGVVIVNKGDAQKIIKINQESFGLGKKYYVYSFTGGTDNGDFSQNVYINGNGPSPNHFGPFNVLSDIKAYSYNIDNDIKLASPGRSVQMIMIEGGPISIRTSKNPVCQGDNNITFSIPKSQGVNYKWTYSGTGATIDNDTLNSISVNFSSTATSGTLTLNAKYPADSTWALDITVGTPVAQPGVITVGKDPVCRGDNNITYSVTNDTTMVYNWTYNGTDATISTDSSNAISINYGPAATSGSLIVTASRNGCSNSRTANVTVSVPAQPSAISTNKNPVCLGDSGIKYSVTNNPLVTYNWTYSGTGATISNGTTSTASINYSKSATSGNLMVTAANSAGCTYSRNLAVTVNAPPAQPSVINARKNPVYQGDIGINYSVTNNTGITYAWTYSGTGATIFNGTYSTISINYSNTATSGKLKVTVANGTGCIDTSTNNQTFDVTVNKLTAVNNINAPDGDVLNISYTYGKPVVTLSYSIAKGSQVIIDIVDIQGRLINRIENSYRKPGSYNIQFNYSALSKGMYIVRFNAGQTMTLKKVLLMD